MAASKQSPAINRLLVLIVAMFMSSCQYDVSGGYVAKSSDAAVWLQLVRTPDNRLTGQFADVLLKPDGTIDKHNVSINGAVDGKTIAFSAAVLGLPVVTLSGKLQDNRLTLHGGESPIVLVRADFSEYQKQVNTLKSQQQKIFADRAAAAARAASEQANQEFLSNIDHTVRQMQQFVSEADTHLYNFSKAEERLHAITAEVSKYVKRERELAGNPATNVQRSQLVVAANQALIATDQLHDAILSFESSLESNVQPTASEANAIEEACQHGVPDLTSAQLQQRDSACGELVQAKTPYREKFEAVLQGVSHLEEAYTEERRTQDTLIQVAEQLQYR